MDIRRVRFSQMEGRTVGKKAGRTEYILISFHSNSSFVRMYSRQNLQQCVWTALASTFDFAPNSEIFRELASETVVNAILP